MPSETALSHAEYLRTEAEISGPPAAAGEPARTDWRHRESGHRRRPPRFADRRTPHSRQWPSLAAAPARGIARAHGPKRDGRNARPRAQPEERARRHFE